MRLTTIFAFALAAVLCGCQAGNPTSALVSAKEGVPAAGVATPAGRCDGPQAGIMPPFKESAFKYRKPLEVSDGGRYMKVPYDEFIDINKRDEVPVRKVRSFYVQKLPAGSGMPSGAKALSATKARRPRQLPSGGARS